MRRRLKQFNSVHSRLSHSSPEVAKTGIAPFPQLGYRCRAAKFSGRRKAAVAH